MCKNQSNSLLVLYWRSLLGFVSDWRLMEMNHCEVLLGSSADLILRVCSWDSPQRHNYLLQFPQIDCRNIIELNTVKYLFPERLDTTGPMDPNIWILTSYFYLKYVLMKFFKSKCLLNKSFPHYIWTFKGDVKKINDFLNSSSDPPRPWYPYRKNQLEMKRKKRIIFSIFSPRTEYFCPNERLHL